MTYCLGENSLVLSDLLLEALDIIAVLLVFQFVVAFRNFGSGLGSLQLFGLHGLELAGKGLKPGLVLGVLRDSLGCSIGEEAQ